MDAQLVRSMNVGARRFAGSQAAFFAARYPQHERAEPAKFLFHFFAQRLNLLAHTGVDGAELVFHSPQSGIVSAAQLHDFPFGAFPYSGIGIVPVALPALQHRFAHAVEARAVRSKSCQKAKIQEALRVVAGNCGVLEIRLARRRTEPL